MNIILADDHLLFREGIRTLIDMTTDYHVVAEVNSSEALINAAIEYEPDLILQDYRMPSGDAISTIKTLREHQPNIKIIILTGVKSGNLYRQLHKLNLEGILLKEISSEFLLKALKDVEEGKSVYSESVEKCVNHQEPEVTSREFQILELIINGLNNNEIADKLSLSVKTVKNHRNSLMQKLDTNNVVSLMKYAQQKGLIDN